jgi:predicted methyltransferase
MRTSLTFFFILAFITGCSDPSENSTQTHDKDTEVNSKQLTTLDLDQILASRPEQEQKRIPQRHPKETLAFFDIQPGMKVGEVLPGRGWYSGIIAPYLGSDGELVGINYDINIWPGNFPFANDQFIEKQTQWTQTWPVDTQKHSLPGASISAFTFSSIPSDADNSFDRVLFIRALHHLARTEKQGEFLSRALSDTLRILKPGGMVGIVQHQSPDGADDEWATGHVGYLKKSFVIAAFEGAGFEFVSESDINENPKDNNPEGQVVWRLPPSYRGSETEEAKAEMDKIGESNRMTLLFKKPE